MIKGQMTIQDALHAPPPSAERVSAKRIRDCLVAADAGRYGRSAWASYMARSDVEVLLRFVEENGA